MFCVLIWIEIFIYSALQPSTRKDINGKTQKLCRIIWFFVLYPIGTTFKCAFWSFTSCFFAFQGHYLHLEGAVDISSCMLCDLGMYCDAPGLSAPEGPCQPGYYCTRGSNTSIPVSPQNPSKNNSKLYIGGNINCAFVNIDIEQYRSPQLYHYWYSHSKPFISS